MMKILHCCLANFYIDNYGYQENILPREHKKIGFDVAILASTETFDVDGRLTYLKAAEYYSDDEIKISRLPYCRWLPHKLMIKLRIYKGLKNYLTVCRPDVIFLHGFQFLSIISLANYLKINTNVKLYIDSHADQNNSAKTILSKYLLHKLLYRFCAKTITRYAEIFWGVLPARVQFLNEMYGIHAEKTALLVMGAEDEKVQAAKVSSLPGSIRNKIHVQPDEFLVVTGGKIDKNKMQVLLLMEAVNQLAGSGIKMGVFGNVAPELRTAFNNKISEFVHYLGWISAAETYLYMEAGDLIFFPGLHSVLWEQAVGLGKPCVFKKINGFSHVDVGGNCLFAESDDITTYKSILLNLKNDKEKFEAMSRNAISKGMKNFSYSEIAKKSIML